MISDRRGDSGSMLVFPIEAGINLFSGIQQGPTLSTSESETFVTGIDTISSCGFKVSGCAHIIIPHEYSKPRFPPNVYLGKTNPNSGMAG